MHDKTNCKHSKYMKGADIVPIRLKKDMTTSELLESAGKTCFEARNVLKGSRLYKKMIDDNDAIWLGIAGAGIVGGLGGVVIDLIERGFIDVICSTGAQIYHDLHFAFGLPVKQINPQADDNDMRKEGAVRIYDIVIDEKETLIGQDEIIRDFVLKYKHELTAKALSSPEFLYLLGQYTLKYAKHPERSFVAMAAKYKIPIFWDSHTNHSIGMNLAKCATEGIDVRVSAHEDILQSAAIVYKTQQTSFVELGGGGPKNFIQQTGPTISQIFGIDFEGAERGIQITTANVKEGGLSGCTFSEGVSWGKYKESDDEKLVQIWSEYSLIFPMMASYVIDNCSERKQKELMDKIIGFRDDLVNRR
ncbi:MAG: deoxyhypusine synthase family protein [Candidatus Aenigmatarchaeota archaeon]